MRDDKCLAGWNALMISAFAEAGATFGERPWLDTASRALRAWHEKAFTNGRLAHAMKDGEAYGTGFLDDYAGLACAAIDVYEATFDRDALAFARTLVDTAPRSVLGRCGRKSVLLAARRRSGDPANARSA